MAAVAGTAAAVLAAPAAGAAMATYAASFSLAGAAAYVGKNIVVAAIETGVESKIAGWTGDDSFSLVGSFGRNLAFNLTAGMVPGAAETKLAAKASLGAAKLATKVGLKGARNVAFGATKYAIHYSSEVAVGTAFDTAWEAGVNGRPIGAAFTQSIVGNSIGQFAGDGLSSVLSRGMKAAGIKQFGRLCFVAGTIVIRGDGGQQPIEQIELGSKVQPRDVNYVEANEPDPATWRKVTLRALNAEDADVEIELLRPLSWLDSQHAAAGSEIHVEIAELNLDGDARVLRIEPRPGDSAWAGCSRHRTIHSRL